MPYVMIPAFPPSHQPLPVTPDSQLALPIQPIPCKPGEWGRGGAASSGGCPEVLKRAPDHARACLPLQCGLPGLAFGSVQWKKNPFFLNFTGRVESDST